MWSLLELYETRLAMREPIDAEQLIAEDTDEYVGPIDIALIESTARITAFRGDLRVKRVRQTPGEVKINLNLAIGLPPGIDPALVPQEVAQRLQQQLQAAIPKMVQDQARRQSPVLRVEARINSGYWRDVTSEAS
jgi:hypothetical protein